MCSLLEGAEVISIYTRQQAIEDGVLVDVTELSKKAGFRFHTVVTNAVWKKCVAWSEEDTKSQLHQDESGRLWDVLSMAIIAARQQPTVSEILYKLYCVPRDGRAKRARLTQLKLHIGPGDNGEAVITIMLPCED